MTTNEQLELGFKGVPRRAPAAKNEDRLARAAWWFAQMRRIVANAMEWPPNGQPPPHQTWLPGAPSK